MTAVLSISSLLVLAGVVSSMSSHGESLSDNRADVPGRTSARRPSSSGGPKEEVVFMVHGLGRTQNSLRWLGNQFRKKGYRVVPLSYRSTRQSVARSAEALQEQIQEALTGNEARVHFVTHSLGGIVLRAYLQKYRPPNLGRVVMLGPPNRGSEVADRLSQNSFYKFFTGPAGQEVGTSPSSVPNQLGPVDYDVGIIAGCVSANPIFSSWIKEKCDGKVSVRRAQVDGMKDLVVIRCSHTFMMRNRKVASQALRFIAKGKFERMET